VGFEGMAFPGVNDANSITITPPTPHSTCPYFLINTPICSSSSRYKKWFILLREYGKGKT
jgi:hypothetical protein